MLCDKTKSNKLTDPAWGIFQLQELLKRLPNLISDIESRSNLLNAPNDLPKRQLAREDKAKVTSM